MPQFPIFKNILKFRQLQDVLRAPDSRHLFRLHSGFYLCSLGLRSLFQHLLQMLVPELPFLVSLHGLEKGVLNLGEVGGIFRFHGRDLLLVGLLHLFHLPLVHLPVSLALHILLPPVFLNCVPDLLRNPPGFQIFLRVLCKISFDFENGTEEVIRLADWDTMKTNRFANKAIAYLLNCENEKLPKETMVAFEL